MFTETELMARLWVTRLQFKKLLAIEVERYSRHLKKQWKEYYEAKIEENPRILKYGNIPTFPPHPFKKSQNIFNNRSGVYLEKMYSIRHKDNADKDLPFDFKFNDSDEFEM